MIHKKVVLLYLGLILGYGSQAQIKIHLEFENDVSYNAPIVFVNNSQALQQSDTVFISTRASDIYHIQIYNTSPYPSLDTTLAVSEFYFHFYPESQSLNNVIITESRYSTLQEKSISSIATLSPQSISSQGNTDLGQSVNRIPGVDIIENQLNIRGGSGWSYGAGSRVLLLLDDIPMLSADASDIKWDFLPLENCGQVEVLKGAASGIYGASALNGVINFRTAFAENKPETSIQLYDGQYRHPRDKSWEWWQAQTSPYYRGGFISHKQKIGLWDLILGGAAYQDKSYLKDASEKRARINFDIRHRTPEGTGLSYGLRFNYQNANFYNFLFWQKQKDSAALYLHPFGEQSDTSTTISHVLASRFYIDPYLVYTTSRGATHRLKTRWYRTDNNVPTTDNRNSIADLYYGEYMYQSLLGSSGDYRINAGALFNIQNVVGSFYGNHRNTNLASYLQLSYDKEKWRWSASGRYEYNHLDDRKAEAKPIFKFGTNYQLAEATYLRASWGQGYRFPSMAERFAYTKFGATQALPNPDLKSETGWTAEIGVSQILRRDNSAYYLDAALYQMRYQNMIEYNFGLHLPKDSTAQQIGINRIGEYIGFQSLNVGKTSISGIDISVRSIHNIGEFNIESTIGYNYTQPKYLNLDSAIEVNLSSDQNILKYRYRNSFKFISDIKWKVWSLGWTLIYNDFMVNVDEVLTNSKPDQNFFGNLFDQGTGGLATSIREFREKYNRGTILLDMRLANASIKNLNLSLIAKNILNTTYMPRPGIIGPLGSWMIQATYKF